MNTIVRNILAVLAGLVVGSFVNILLVNIGPTVIPLPKGTDVSTMEKLRDSMALFTPANFLFPFLGHAVGTLVGAFTAAKLAASRPMTFALGISAFFLLGGIATIRMIGGPMWFQVLDLVSAYLPMGYLGGMLAGVKFRKLPDGLNIINVVCVIGPACAVVRADRPLAYCVSQ